jgi:hypothetical protein
MRLEKHRFQVGVLTALVFTVGPALLGPRPASATAFTVCSEGCTYSQIGPAVAAAGGGDVVSIGPGRYAGGFTIDHSLSLVGAGARETTISGGGPVITVGKFGAKTEPTVALRDLTITGGVTASSPVSIAYYSKPGVIALGGGIFVPPAANFGTGATLTVTNSVIAGNIAAPTASIDAGFSCGTHDCRFALAGGGGIDNWGVLTVDNTIVSNNESAGSGTSEADGAGIFTQQGSLTVRNSVVTANRAMASAPNGLFAQGAGLMFDTSISQGACTPCTLSIQNSIVRDNRSSLVNNMLPSSVGAQTGMNANGGGVHVGDGIPSKVVNSAIDGNSATAIDERGELFGIDAGMIVGYSPLVMQNSQVDDNRSTTTEATSTDVGPGGSALELDGGGTISGSSIDGNFASSTSRSGLADTNGGLAVFYFGNPGGAQLVTVRNSVISGNVTESLSKTGSAQIEGGAVFNNSLLVMRNDSVTDNVGRAEAPTGVAQGGGIWNGVDTSTGASPPAELTLVNTIVTHNVLEGRAGVTLQGGGIFTVSPATLTLIDTRIAFNRPDQCFGC